MKSYGVDYMSPKSTGIQVIRKVEEEKPTDLEAFLTGFLLISLVLIPITMAGVILTRTWTNFGIGETSGIYLFGFGSGLLLSFIFSVIFMKLATR
jgi:hypothetical protein